MYKSFFKRFFDFLAALTGLILTLPVSIIIASVLMFVNNGRPFFFQPRPGKNEKVFNIIKFKTMTDKTDSQGNLLPNHLRVTAFGSFLRKSSLDEIPQLLNILKGDMSLVGPRPLLPKYLPLYNEEQRKRHLVKPGITGWAQVNGRNAISWEKKFEYDVYYAINISALFDLKIIFLTIKKVVKQEGINSQSSVTMPAFTGTKN